MKKILMFIARVIACAILVAATIPTSKLAFSGWCVTMDIIKYDGWGYLLDIGSLGLMDGFIIFTIATVAFPCLVFMIVKKSCRPKEGLKLRDMKDYKKALKKEKHHYMQMGFPKKWINSQSKKSKKLHRKLLNKEK